MRFRSSAKLVRHLREVLKHTGLHVRRYTPVSDWREVLLHHARRHGVRTIVDVGANVGQFATEIFSAGWDARVLSIEPLPEAHATLSARAARNASWTVLPRCAAGDQAGVAKINISDNSASSSILAATPKLNAIAPQARVIAQASTDVWPLSDIIMKAGAPGPYLIKMDVQGYEGKVLAGAEEIMPDVCMIYTEMSLEPIYEGELNFAQLSQYIIDLGFGCVAMYPGYADYAAREISQVDAIFVRR
jgi:FkbM family methyltransferase